MMRSKKRGIAAILAAVAIFGAVYAMAASLGGITSDAVGADNTIVASCDTDGVTTSYTTSWDAADERYEITAVTVGGVADTCDGQTMKVTLADASGTSLSEGTLSLPSSAATSFAVTMSPAASAQLTEAVHVLIAG
jgi:anti-sigma-K factor RskA